MNILNSFNTALGTIFLESFLTIVAKVILQISTFSGIDACKLKSRKGWGENHGRLLKRFLFVSVLNEKKNIFTVIISFFFLNVFEIVGKILFRWSRQVRLTSTDCASKIICRSSFKTLTSFCLVFCIYSLFLSNLYFTQLKPLLSALHIKFHSDNSVGMYLTR